MAAGDTVFGDHATLIARVPSLLDTTEKALQKTPKTDNTQSGTVPADTEIPDTVHPMIIAARFHGYFEYLHPFRDGNGRTGRLISNYILMRKGLPPFTIMLEERAAYIAALRQIRTENTDEHLIRFFLERATQHMLDEMQQKQHNARPRLFLF